MTGTALKPLPGAITERPAPTLSETLHKFIQERGVPGDLTVFANGAKAIVDIRKLWLEFDRSAETQAAGRVLQGFCLAWIRYTSPGEFVSGLAERGMPVRSAYDLMEDFEAFNRLPNLKQIGRLSEIGSSKTRMLAKALGDDLPKFLDGKSTFYGLVPDEVEAASVVDLIKHQRQQDDKSSPLLQEKARLGSELEKSQVELKNLRVQLGEASKAGAVPLWHRRVLNESAALSEGMAVYLAQLEAVLEDDLYRAPRSSNAERALVSNAAAAAFIQARGIHAACERVLRRMIDTFGDRISTEEIASMLSLDEREIDVLTRRRQSMLELAAVQQQRRGYELPVQASAIGAQPKRKRGKPKGSRNKPKAKR